MTTANDPPPAGDNDEGRHTISPDENQRMERIGQLRGAGVQVDGRRVGRVVLGIIVVTLATLVIVFTVTGVHTNQQDDRLHNEGVPVTFTVTGCLGLLGGSGSNAAGYACHGTYALEGRHYREPLPGTSFHRPGSTVAAIAVPGDPALVSPSSIVATEHSSASVFVLPGILAAVLLLLVAFLFVRRRRRRRDGTQSHDGTPSKEAPAAS